MKLLFKSLRSALLRSILILQGILVPEMHPEVLEHLWGKSVCVHLSQQPGKRRQGIDDSFTSGGSVVTDENIAVVTLPCDSLGEEETSSADKDQEKLVNQLVLTVF